MRDRVVQIRVTDQEKTAFEMAAEYEGTTATDWMRQRLRSAAIRDLQNAGQVAPFVKAIPFLAHRYELPDDDTR